jgi:ribosome-binding factor A
MPLYRKKRISDLIKLELSSIIQHELRDPRIGFVTITHVKMSSDLRHAKVYFSIYGDAKMVENSLQGLKSSIGFLRREICHRLKLRYCPTLELFLDTSIKDSAHIEELIEKMKKKRQEGNTSIYKNEEKNSKYNKTERLFPYIITYKS